MCVWQNKRMPESSWKTDNILMLMITLSIPAVLLMYKAVYALGMESIMLGSTCRIKQLTGWYCPGCGATRALKSLLRGDVINSIRYNPFVFYCLSLGAVYYAGNALRILSRNHIKALHYRNSWLYGGVIVLAVNFIVKNFCLFVLGIDLLK